MNEEEITNSIIKFIEYYRNKGYSDKWILNRFNVFLNRIIFEENIYKYLPINN